MTTRHQIAVSILLLMLSTSLSMAVSSEETNTCQSTSDNPCTRTGTCSIQGADWYQDVTIDRSDTFATQGWTGLCDMVHVALVQGNCQPAGSKVDLTVDLSPSSFARIPLVSGPLSCVGDSSGAAGSVPDGWRTPGALLSVDLLEDGSLVLAWGDSCLGTDIDFAIYEGLLEAGFDSHQSLTCSTGGLTTATIIPGGGSHYFLVVSLSTTNEGSYGFDSRGG